MATDQLEEDTRFKSIEDLKFESGTIEDFLLRTYKELILHPHKLIAKELETLDQRIRKQEEKLGEIIEKIGKIEKAMELKEEGGSFLDKFF